MLFVSGTFWGTGYLRCWVLSERNNKKGIKVLTQLETNLIKLVILRYEYDTQFGGNVGGSEARRLGVGVGGVYFGAVIYIAIHSSLINNSDCWNTQHWSTITKATVGYHKSPSQSQFFQLRRYLHIIYRTQPEAAMIKPVTIDDAADNGLETYCFTGR